MQTSRSSLTGSRGATTRPRWRSARPASRSPHNGTLYVADTLESRIIAIPNAMTRTTPLADNGITVSAGGHLKQPLGLVLAPNGDILTTNAGDGNIVETTPAGQQIATVAGDAKAGAGSLFGLAIAPGGKGLVYVDDASNTLRLLHCSLNPHQRNSGWCRISSQQGGITRCRQRSSPAPCRHRSFLDGRCWVRTSDLRL